MKITNRRIKRLEAFPEQTFEFPEKIDQGAESIVYKISNKYVAKVPRHNFLRLEKEFFIARGLYNKNISVPIPYGMFNITFWDLVRPAYIMEYIPGERLDTLRKLSKNERDKINNLFSREIEKVEDIGFTMDDVGTHNAIWSPEKQKVYLIDFSDWKKPGFFKKLIGKYKK